MTTLAGPEILKGRKAVLGCHPLKRQLRAVTLCPGYDRRLAIVGNYAVVGLSLARENRTFADLALEAAGSDMTRMHVPDFL